MSVVRYGQCDAAHCCPLCSSEGMSMRAIWITGTGGPEALEVRETADPEPGPGQVRVRVRAAGLNFADVMAAQGLYPDAPKPPCVVGYEAAGVIDALGDGVQDLAAGQRVVALTHFGGHADVLCVPAGQVFQIPGEMSFEEAARGACPGSVRREFSRLVT